MCSQKLAHYDCIVPTQNSFVTNIIFMDRSTVCARNSMDNYITCTEETYKQYEE